MKIKGENMSDYILVTGGTGFIGSHLLEELLNQNKKCILLKRSFSNTWRIDKIIEHENLIIKDVDKENLADIFSQYDIEGIFHLATFYERSHKSEEIAEMIDSNINFPTQLLENAINSKVKFFINTGTFSEYDLDSSPISENSKLEAFNLYSSTKTAFECILKFYHEKHDLKCATLKLFTPYGPKDDVNKITPYLINKSINKEEILVKSPNKKLDFIYVTDIVYAFITVMENIKEFENYEAFTLGTGVGTTLKDLLSIIESNLGENENVSFGNLEDNQVWCSNEKIKEKLNWQPKIKLEEGIKKTIDYYKNN